MLMRMLCYCQLISVTLQKTGKSRQLSGNLIPSHSDTVSAILKMFSMNKNRRHFILSLNILFADDQKFNPYFSSVWLSFSKTSESDTTRCTNYLSKLPQKLADGVQLPKSQLPIVLNIMSRFLG